MAKPNSPNTPNKYYFYNDATKIVWHAEFMPEDRNDLIYIGTSDNPNVVMAAAYFMRDMVDPTGYKVQELVELTE